MISGFDSITGYWKFVNAKEFTKKDEFDTAFAYKKNLCERIGGILVYPILQPVDFSIANSRNPLMILTLTICALFATTVIFYPSVIAGMFIISGTIIKAVFFTLTQTMILGIGLRALGRLNNSSLMNEWEKDHLNTQAIGTIRLR